MFEKVEDESMNTLNGAFAGMKVDLFDKNAQKWLPGTVDKVTRASLKDVRIKVIKDGFPPEFAVDVQWPNPLAVDWCGEKLTDRECDEKSMKPNNGDGFEAKICFTPLDSCPEGFKPDNGHVYGKKGSFTYGWGRDCTSNARDR